MRLLFSSFILISLVVISSCGNSNVKKTKAPINKIEELSKNIQSNPNKLELYIERANLYIQKNNINNAIIDYQKAISIAPDSITYYMKIADLFLQQGQIKNTLDILNKVTKVNPNYTQAWIKIGEIHLMFKKYPEVFKYANKALEIDPYNDKAFFLKAYAYKENADTNKAIDNFQQCLKFNPNNYEANVELGILFMGLKNKLAINYFENAISLDSSKILAYYDLGLFYQDNDMLNEAMATYKKLNKIDPSFPNSYYNIGYIYLQILNISEESIPYFTKAIEVKPDYYQAYFNLGLAHEKLGDILNAEKNYKEALRINPNYNHAITALNRVQEIINK